MFAYCGNNPVNYSDPSGNAYQGIYSQFNYCEYEHTYGGLRENFYYFPDINEISDSDMLNVAKSVADTCVTTAVSNIIPGVGVPFAVIGFLESYENCRLAGVGTWQSLGIAVLSGGVSNFPYDRFNINQSYSKDITLAFMGQDLESILIEQALEGIPASQQIRNRQIYLNNRSASFSVGGGLRYMYTDYTGMRRDLIGNP